MEVPVKRTLHPLLWLLVLVGAAPALGADITFFEREGFQGRSFTANQTIPNFADIGFNDRASSVVVRSGHWQLCSDAYFRGRCMSVNPGEYPTLRSLQLENQISSARELDWIGGARPPGGGGGGRVELFEANGFGGRPYMVNGTIQNLSDVGFNDRAQSMIVHDGSWEACEHADFRGACQVFGPGRYPTLAQFSGRISSLRPVVGGAVPVPGAISGWGTGARAILYAGPNLSGRSFVVNNEVVPNLANVGFNDRASSLRVEAGYWVFCSDANFSGECMTFGPGDYPVLPGGLNNRVSSGRRIHQQYPYSQNPNWQR
jgi:beta/gamma crystallin